MTTTRTRAATGAVVLLLGATLTSCTSDQTDQQIPPETATSTAPETAAALPTPINIIAPDNREDCTTLLDKSDAGLEDPDRVTIRCADKSTTLAGTFRDRYTNVYDPADAEDIEKVIVVGDEVRAWVSYGGITCLIVHVPGEPSTECEPTEQREASTPEPGPAQTFNG